MRQNQSLFGDFVEIMSRIPWWLNIILAAIAYATLHQIAITFDDPAPQLEVGQLGAFAMDKFKSVLALFGQFVLPFGFLLAGLIGLVKKFKRTGQYKELIIYVILNILFFGSVISKDGGINNSIQKRLVNSSTKQSGKKEETKIYSWINEKGNKVYSNTPPSQ
ncbi:MAG: hypothetical protein PHI97_29045 [Desulfobulbus sp.]|nr:hypothetical protein [Desulfobulbus sp.]